MSPRIIRKYGANCSRAGSIIKETFYERLGLRYTSPNKVVTAKHLKQCSLWAAQSLINRCVLKMSLEKIQIVLVEPSHPGNIGAVARAMKTMGLETLHLINPKKFPHYEASKRAAGGESVLDSAKVFDRLAESLADCTLVLGTSVRDREISWPTNDPRDSAQLVSQHLLQFGEHELGQVAVVFGRESSGLSNAELQLCHAQLRIDANPEYSSLNLASAVQIIAYELRVALIYAGRANQSQPLTAADKRKLPATEAQREGHLQHLQKVLADVDFVKSESSTVLLRKLTRLYSKAELTVEEVQILRGILTAVQNQISAAD